LRGFLVFTCYSGYTYKSVYHICHINIGNHAVDQYKCYINTKMQVNFSKSRRSNVPGMEEVIKHMLTMIHNQLVGLIIFSSCDLSLITT